MDQSYLELVPAACEQISEGAFLMTGAPANPMTIGWCQFGVVFGRPICTVMVRRSRYTHELIENNGVFTVSVPHPGAMREELAYCGSHSGRDGEKCKQLGMRTLPARAGGAEALSGCAMHFECRVVFKTESDLADMDPSILRRYYKGLPNAAGDPHTFYFGEILASYRE